MGVHCCLHINCIVYKHFDRSQHVGSSDPTCVQNFRSIPPTVFEILGFKLNDNNKKNWRNEPFVISPMLVVQILGAHTYMLSLAIILLCQKWIITESKSANWNF